MIEEKMKYYNALRQPPPEALKQIQGGRISGKTDVNPQWRYRAVTEQFGPCGVGWKYNIEKLWLEPADGGQVCAFSLVNVWVKIDGEWSEPIPGIGGSMLTEQEKAGLHVSDECFKMATTDALSVALKMLGVAADIYAGAWDGSKYKDESASADRKPAENKPDTGDHFCKQHGVKYFKTVKMKAFAHPIEGTNEWCYERSKNDTLAEEKQPVGEKPSKIPSLKNLGELYTRAAKYGLSPRDICNACGVGTGEEITDWDAAWLKTAKKFKVQIKSFIDKQR